MDQVSSAVNRAGALLVAAFLLVVPSMAAAVTLTPENAAAMASLLNSWDVSQGFEGHGVQVYYRATDELIFEEYDGYGVWQNAPSAPIWHGPSTDMPVASVSKIVTSYVILSMVEWLEGIIDLDSTTGEVLGWDASAYPFWDVRSKLDDITLRQLLSFTSGLHESYLDGCQYLPWKSLAACADEVLQNVQESPALFAKPGSTFDYGAAHMVVAGLMLEVVVGASWNEIAEAVFSADGLALTSDPAYYALPFPMLGPNNPNPAGGLRVSADDLATIVRRIDEKMVAGVGPFAEMAENHYPDAIIRTTPLHNSPDFADARYGLGGWRECFPEPNCPDGLVFSSAGAYGSYPFIEVDGRYAGVIMRGSELVAEAGLSSMVAGRALRAELDALGEPPVFDEMAQQNLTGNNTWQTFQLTFSDVDADSWSVACTSANCPRTWRFLVTHGDMNRWAKVWWKPLATAAGTYDLTFTVTDGDFNDDVVVRVVVH